MVQDLTVPLLHLFERVRGVKGCDGDIAAIDDTEAFFEGIKAPDCVIASPFLFA
jgi:hypothetical protein